MAAVHGGFVEVRDNRVSILSDVAELADQIDVERARRAKEEAEKKLMSGDDAESEAQLRRAHARRYSELLLESGVRLPGMPEDASHAFHLYVIRTKVREISSNRAPRWSKGAPSASYSACDIGALR